MPPFEMVRRTRVEECRSTLRSAVTPHGRKVQIVHVDAAGNVAECVGPLMYNPFWPKKSPPDSACVNVGLDGKISIRVIPFGCILDFIIGQESSDSSTPDWIENLGPKPT